MAKKDEVITTEAIKEEVVQPKNPTSILKAFGELSIRDVVIKANKEEIKREDIVTLLKENGQYVLVYYK